METLYKSLGVIPYMVSPRDIKHNKKVVSMRIFIWNKSLQISNDIFMSEVPKCYSYGDPVPPSVEDTDM